ncbi:hypothetical protein [Haloplanus aerogenes]|uniref:Uncharacterized protein n=1 Tax=Haloplanus aerogenes TaxID=660522 RepID=A0A3G8QXT8_9EURY|nr:hypothetical protein [Haloplanus aerogenes]AZH26408.1 hypothetical protein DU502_13990 [Haloplanus aerogenes]
MSDDEPRSAAVENLTTLGSNTYAARTFVALTVLGDGTAQEVSDVVDVPRTRRRSSRCGTGRIPRPADS